MLSPAHLKPVLPAVFAAALIACAWLTSPAVLWDRPQAQHDPSASAPSVGLITSTTPYIADSSPNDSVPWTKDAFRSTHHISVLPRIAELEESAPSERDLLFAFTTTADRAIAYASLWRHFLDRDSFCFVLLPPSDAARAQELQQHFRDRVDLSCDVRTSNIERYEDRVGSVVLEASQLAVARSRSYAWLLIGDDDTFWLDMRVVRRLLGRFDQGRAWFIGGITEATAQYGAFGRQAYGGAGIIISQPLAHEMGARLPECLKIVEGVWTGGDGVLTYCAALVKGVDHADVMTEALGMHQMDVPGDGCGFFQSGRPFVTVHHYIDGWVDFVPKSWPGSHSDDRYAISVIGKSVRFLGGDNLFRRYVFEDGRVLYTQGYSITTFETPLHPADLTKMEYTWSYDGYSMRFPERPNIQEGSAKTSYYIFDVLDDGLDARGRARARFVFAARDGRRIVIRWSEA